ncbi:hypothetical protein [Streptomyces antimicrobicus]|uniref:WxL domain-containing protein n=1 Tax=Streptomyces antimicrobicus TaxID=2883108 RepID=A0ABS8B0L7_9ACTN|nr:hypothetical protein [Streptomyces antimicrobicus]MCB5178156.1 hypothetical protein [Streptomyces antimicrobicus]
MNRAGGTGRRRGGLRGRAWIAAAGAAALATGLTTPAAPATAATPPGGAAPRTTHAPPPAASGRSERPGRTHAPPAPRTPVLSMTQDGAALTLGAVANGQGGGAAGRIGTVTVLDVRGVPAGSGWTLRGAVTAFTGAGGRPVPGASLTWAPTCAPARGSLGRCTAGPAGAVGPEGAVLASADGGGRFTVDATVLLRLPPYTRTGSYRAVLTLTLTEGPPSP